jgi:hypothetical protein
VFGGLNDAGNIASAELFSLKQGYWSWLPQMPVELNNITAIRRERLYFLVAFNSNSLFSFDWNTYTRLEVQVSADMYKHLVVF